MKYMRDYIDVNRLHTALSMEVLEMERKTQICIYNILHTDAWKHRLKGNRTAMVLCQKLAASALRQSKTYVNLIKTLWV